MTVNKACKVCHKPIFVEIDPSYKETGDPWKLLSMATCNKCADYLTLKRRITDRLFRLCADLQSARHRCPDDKLNDREAAFVPKLEKATKAYAQCLSDHLMSRYWWNIEFVQMLMDKPEQCGAILSGYMTTYRTQVVNPQHV